MSKTVNLGKNWMKIEQKMRYPMVKNWEEQKMQKCINECLNVDPHWMV